MSGRPRVLEVLQPEDGGVAEHVLWLSRGLAERGWEVEVAASPTNVIRGPLADSGIAFHELPLVRELSIGDLRAARELRALDARGDYDIVHAHSSKAGGLARLVLPDGRSVVYTAHGFSFAGEGGPARRLMYRCIEQALVPRTDAVVAVCQWERENSVAALRGAERRCHVVRNGVPGCADDPADRALLDFRGDLPLVGAVTVLRPEKDPCAAIQAMALLGEAGRCPARLAVVGNGLLQPEVLAEIRRLGLSDHVRWFPFEGSMSRYLRGLDVFVLPSLWEAMPLGPMEAMACGVPVVASRVGGVPEIVDDGVTGRLVPPDAPAALAGALEELVTDSARRRVMSEAAREQAAERFRLDPAIDAMEAIYSDVLDGRS